MSTAEPAAPLIEPGDVAGRLAKGGYSGLEKTQIELLCVDVSAIIRGRRRGIDEWIADGRLDRATVVAVACQVLIRALHSIESGGITIVGESHPEYSVQFSQAAKAGLYLDADQVRDLTPPEVDGSRGRAFSIMPS